MDLKDIQELIKFVAKSGATEVDLEIDNVKISIKSPPKKRRGATDEAPIFVQHETAPVSDQPVTINPPQAVPPTSNITKSETKSEASGDNENLITVKSSMIGTFYRSASPEKPPFVSVGDSINEGDTICIIEAMKLFNEIESEVSGVVEQICVSNEQAVEYGQTLFRLKKA